MTENTIPEPSDQMGPFSFDGAEGIAFWVDTRDERDGSTRVLFDDLPTMVAFMRHNLPGLFPILDGDADKTALSIADGAIEAIAATEWADVRWQDISQSIHVVSRRAYLAGEMSAVNKLHEQLGAHLQARTDILDSLSHVEETTDARTLALRVSARLQGDPNWESVEYDDGEERIDPEMVPK
ncbi:MAG: hypothetical protein K0S70_138 [Microbacterium sp.]|jgi:hypothetical protein|nr:hypothetical protein [Microbacterium sp.]